MMASQEFILQDTLVDEELAEVIAYEVAPYVDRAIALREGKTYLAKLNPETAAFIGHDLLGGVDTEIANILDEVNHIAVVIEDENDRENEAKLIDESDDWSKEEVQQYADASFERWHEYDDDENDKAELRHSLIDRIHPDDERYSKYIRGIRNTFWYHCYARSWNGTDPRRKPELDVPLIRIEKFLDQKSVNLASS